MSILRYFERRGEQHGRTENVRNDRKEAEEIDGIEARDSELPMQLHGDRAEDDQREDAAKDSHL